MNNIQVVLNKIGYVDLRDFGGEWRTRPLYRASDNPLSFLITKEVDYGMILAKELVEILLN